MTVASPPDTSPFDRRPRSLAEAEAQIAEIRALLGAVGHAHRNPPREIFDRAPAAALVSCRQVRPQ